MSTIHKCVLCELEFNDKQTLQKHFRKHGEKTIFFQEESRLNDKQEELAGPSPGLVQCDVCPEQFPSIARAISHMHKVHRNQYFKHLCPWCGKQFPIKHLWQIHMKSHSSEVDAEPEELYTCDRCNFDFYNTTAIQYHTSSFHREEMIAGAAAGPMTSGVNLLVTPQVLPSRQMKVTQNRGTCAVYYCKHCGCEYFNPNHLLKHIETNHRNLETSPSDMILCSTCDSIFCNSAAYEVHLIYHKNLETYIDSDAVQLKLVQDRVRESQTNKRDLIKENHSLATNLQYSAAAKESRTSERQGSDSGLVSCDVCPRQFPSIAAAISHMHQAHRNAYVKHLCPWCAKQFPLKHLWEVHMESHKCEDKPKEEHKCEACNFTFFCRLAAEYHSASFHVTERVARLGHAPPPSNILKRAANKQDACLVYYCHHCGCEYISKYNLQVHISASHKDVMDEFPTDVQTCKICDSVFYNTGAYNVHLLYHKDDDTYVDDMNKRSKLLSQIDGDLIYSLVPNVQAADTRPTSGNHSNSKKTQNGGSEGDETSRIESGSEEADTNDADSNEDEGDSNAEPKDSNDDESDLNEENQEEMDVNEGEELANEDELPEINTGADLLALLAGTSAAGDEDRPRKKKKKHKKSKRALTLDEFVNMNKDIFGDCIGNSIQGVEEVSHKALTNRRARVGGQRLLKPQKIINHPIGKIVRPGGANNVMHVRPNVTSNIVKGLPVKMGGVSVRPVQVSGRMIRPGVAAVPRVIRPGGQVQGQRMARPMVPIMVQKISRPGGSGMSNIPSVSTQIMTARPVAPIKPLGSVGPSSVVRSLGPSNVVRKSAPTRSSGLIRASGPVRASGPIRSAGPIRPIGPIRPSRPIGPAGQVRPSGPVRLSGPIRPTGVRPSGLLRPLGPILNQKIKMSTAIGSECLANIQKVSTGPSASPPPVQKPAQPEESSDNHQPIQESEPSIKPQSINKAEVSVPKMSNSNGTSDMLEKLQRQGLISIKKTGSK